jgi:molybdopterin-binding protein
MPPESRPVGVVFQDYLLFPHLTALDNVAFGPRCRGASKAEARAQAAEWLDRMGLADHAGAKPRRLSGGQAQRVAVARALATRPRLLLLDEPLAALDARTRLEVRAQLRRHLAEFEAVAVLVTHDPLDAMVLADRLVVVEHGRVVQEGTPSHIARHPRTDYIARLVGLNLYRGRAEGHTVRLDTGPAITTTEELSGPAFVAFPPHGLQRPQPLALRGRRTGDARRPDPRGPHRRTAPDRRPHHGRRGRTRPAPRRPGLGGGQGDANARIPGIGNASGYRAPMSLSIRNQLPGTVTAVTPGEAMATVRVRLTGGQALTAAITREAADDLGLTPGTAVRALVKSTEVSLATAPVEGLSIRNRLPGTVTDVATGDAMASVRVTVEGGELTAAITRDAADDLALSAGTPVVALIKSTEVSLAAE